MLFDIDMGFRIEVGKEGGVMECKDLSMRRRFCGFFLTMCLIYYFVFFYFVCFWIYLLVFCGIVFFIKCFFLVKLRKLFIILLVSGIIYKVIVMREIMYFGLFGMDCFR